MASTGSGIGLLLAGVVLGLGVGLPAFGQRSVTLAWDATSETPEYDFALYCGVRSGLYSRRMLSGGKTNFTVGGLKDGITYYFAVAAISWDGSESWPSTELQYAPPCSGRIVNLTATTEASTEHGVRLSLPATPGRSYEVLASDDLLSWAPVWTSSVAQAHTLLEFVDPGPPSTGRRFFRAQVAGPYAELERGLTVAAVSGSNDLARIGFSAVAGTSYEVQFSTDGSKWKSVWNNPAGTTSGWREFLDRQTNAVSARRYRLLFAPNIAASGESPCSGSPTQPPVIEDIPHQATYLGIPTLPIPVLLSDPDTPASQLELTVTSSDPALFPPGQIKVTGNGAKRTLVITPSHAKVGVGVIELVVSDGANASATAFELSVLPDVPDTFPVVLRAIGAGTILPNLDGQDLKVGKRYTVTAIPDEGHLFLGWAGDIESTSPRLSFVMRPRLTLEAVFAVNPFAAIQGPYQGLFRAEGDFRAERSGSVQVKVTERGTYSGKLMLGGKSHSFAGQLDTDRNGTNVIKRTGGMPPLTLEVAFGGGNSDQFSGRVTDGSWQAALNGHRAGYASKDLSAPFAGAFTLVIPGQSVSPAEPEGAGFGRVKIDARGQATFAGILADGTKVSTRATISAEGEWALYAPLYSKLGAVHGWQTVSLDESNGLRGQLSWAKPALPKAKIYSGGFTFETLATGSRYVRPIPSSAPVLNLDEADLEFRGGNLASPFTNRVALVAKNKVSNLSSNKLSMTFSLSSGLFNGRVTDPITGKSSSFKGALLQDRNQGMGFLLGTNRSARVELAP